MPTLGMGRGRLTKVERALGAVLYVTGREASTERFHGGKEMFMFSCGRSSSSGLEDNSFIYHPPVRKGSVRQDCVWVAGQEQGELGGRKTSCKCFKDGPELRQAQRGWGEGT